MQRCPQVVHCVNDPVVPLVNKKGDARRESREKFRTPPSLPPSLTILRGWGAGYILNPTVAEFYVPPPLLYTPRPWKGGFRGGGVGLYKNLPPTPQRRGVCQDRDYRHPKAGQVV